MAAYTFVLSDQQDDLVQKLLAEGRFQDVDEILLRALDLLQAGIEAGVAPDLLACNTTAFVTKAQEMEALVAVCSTEMTDARAFDHYLGKLLGRTQEQALLKDK